MVWGGGHRELQTVSSFMGDPDAEKEGRGREKVHKEMAYRQS